jgi:optic atrophy protein 1
LNFDSTFASQVGWETLKDEFSKMLEEDRKQKGHDDIFDSLKEAVKDTSLDQHQWDTKAQESLRVIQMNMLEDRSVHNKNQWDAAITFMDAAVRERLAISE